MYIEIVLVVVLVVLVLTNSVSIGSTTQHYEPMSLTLSRPSLL